MEDGVPQESPRDQVDDEGNDTPVIESPKSESGEVHPLASADSSVFHTGWHHIKSSWTTRPKWQKWVVVGLCALLLIDPMKTAFNNVFQPHRVFEEAFKQIKNAMVQGPRELVEQFPEDMVMDFRQGSLVIWLSGSRVRTSESMRLQIKSIHDPDRMLTVNKDESNILRACLEYPSLGSVERSAQLKVTDIESKELPFIGMTNVVCVAFTWNLDEAESSLYVNGKDTSSQ